MAFCFGALFGINNSNELMKGWKETLRLWKEDREYFQKSLEILANKK